MKKIKLLSWFLLVIFFTNCENEEVATEIKEDNIVSINSSRISISELYNEIQSPEIKTILQNKSFYKLNNDSFSRINDANVTFIKIQKRDSLTTYILNLNSYSQQNPYFLKFIITKNYNETEKVGYLKYIPTTPTVLLDLKSFTGEAQILNNELEITASTQFINGVKQENQSKTENLLRGRCRDLIDIVEVKCSHSGEHGVGESCNTGYINDAHYEIYITTTCNDPSTPVEIIDDTSNPNLYNDGAGGSITDVLENILTPEELLWWNNANVNTKNAILDYLNPRVNDGEAWMFTKELISELSNDIYSSDEDISEITKVLIYAQQYNYFNQNFDIDFYNGVDSFTQVNLQDPILLIQFAKLFATHCAILKQENPGWSNFKVLKQAWLDATHLSLDLAGLVPAFGEIADVTNGVIYTIEGDGLNATLSYASAIPVAGWFATGAKYANKIQIVYTIGTKVRLSYRVLANGLIYFGSNSTCRAQLRRVLGLAVGNPLIAHHIIPLGIQTHEVVQKAAKSGSAFHMNEALNGIGLSTLVHSGSHGAYDAKILQKFNDFLLANPNATPNQCYAKANQVIQEIRTAIANNPNTPINQLNF
ncbi:AHH domain-containing protein [Flavobacterium sp. HNIBRBA15423]|uniref:AHH domain-containing protein n=1 Tax=Flavobacterium sp. HNIBRBA15423 TaxID=3458683 RepID=UPI004043B322